MILKTQLMVLKPNETKVAVKYVTADNIQYAMNGMPGAMLTVLMPKVLNSEVMNVETDGEYLCITIKEPSNQSAATGNAADDENKK